MKQNMNARDGETVNACENLLSLHECEKNMPINVQIIMKIIGLYQGSIHES